MSKLQSQNRVDDVMTRDPITLSADMDLNSAAHLMWTHNRSCLPVVDAGKRVVGILTDRDVAMCAYTQGRRLAELPVGLAMEHDVICAHAGDDRELVEALMESHDVHRVPVVDALGVLLGVVSRLDLIDHTRPRSRFASALLATPLRSSQAASSTTGARPNGAQ